MVTLKWSLDKEPEQLTLQAEGIGLTIPLLGKADRSCALTGPFKGRIRLSLTTHIRDEAQGKDATDTCHLNAMVPGVAVLAGDAENVGASYMSAATPGVRPWGKVTGMAWKSPWLYFSQGDQHTIRRVNLAVDEVEEVAGMRGLPADGTNHKDRLFEPAQLLHRSGGLVEDWLVLQPNANCIQTFQEGQVATSMKVLAGLFNPKATVAPPSNPERFKGPTAMAAHPLSGHVFVADWGNRAIKMVTPAGLVKILASPVEAGGIAVNDQGDVFFSDTAHHVIKVLRRQGPDFAYGAAEGFAGAQDKAGAMDGARNREARFRLPRGLAMDTVERPTLLIADTGNHLVRRVAADLDAQQELVETIGGNPHAIKANLEHMAIHPSGLVAKVDLATRDIALYSQDGLSVTPIPHSRGFDPHGVALDLAGNLYFSEPGRRVVRVLKRLPGPFEMGAQYAPAEIFAGKEDEPGKKEGPRTTEARFQSPEGLAMDKRDPGILLVNDPGNEVFWKIPVDLDHDQPAMTGGKAYPPPLKPTNHGLQDGPQVEALFSHPRQVCGDGNGRVFVLDQTEQSPLIRIIDPAGNVTTLGGITQDTTARGRADGKGDAAGFMQPVGIAVTPSGVIHVADSGNRCVRSIGQDGTVTVAAGNIEDAKAAQDDVTLEDATFGALGYLGVDALGRTLIVEPEFGNFRILDPAKAKVIKVKGGLAGARVCTFPAGAPKYVNGNYPFVLAIPGSNGDYTIKVRQGLEDHDEVVATRTPLQAMCADRSNRICIVLPPDPAHPGVLQFHRFSYPVPRTGPDWLREPMVENPQKPGKMIHLPPARLPLNPGGEDRLVNGRRHALWAEPRISAMAADSHNNLYLADAMNGAIWKVDEAMTTLTRVAGAYPHLGPLGRKADGPLLAMQGLALTPADDVVVTCGNAVVQITQTHTQAPRDWKPLDFAAPPKPVKASATSSTAKVKPTTLKDAKAEEHWTILRNRCQAARQRDAQTCLDLVITKQAADEAYLNDPSSSQLKLKIELLTRPLAQARTAAALSEAEADAREEAYQCLLWLDAFKDAKGQQLVEAQARLAEYKASSDAKQARFETLALLQEQGSNPLPAAVQARLRHLETFREARAAEAEKLRKEGWNKEAEADLAKKAQATLDAGFHSWTPPVPW